MSVRGAGKSLRCAGRAGTLTVGGGKRRPRLSAEGLDEVEHVKTAIVCMARAWVGRWEGACSVRILRCGSDAMRGGALVRGALVRTVVRLLRDTAKHDVRHA